MTTDNHTPDQVTYPPSYFANLGQPMCSRWGKSEVECIALAYVQALAADGDTWKKLSRKQTYELLTDEQRQRIHGMLTFKDDLYERWFDAVSEQLTDSAGAFGVRGFWWGPR